MNNRLSRIVLIVITLGLLCLAGTTQFAGAAQVSNSHLGPLVLVSYPNPLAGCDDGFRFPARQSFQAATEPYVVVNPTNSKNIAAIWIGGWAQGIIAGVSLDGGSSWQRVAIPGLTACSGGTHPAVVDPWLAFAPNGDLYAIMLPVDSSSFSPSYVLVNKSTDGGLDWSAPLVLANGAVDKHNQPDHPSITADPTNSNLVYAVWNGSDSGHRGPSLFSRTTDAGKTWAPARVLVSTDPQDFVQFSQILVLPDGSLTDLYELVNFVNNSQGIQYHFSLQILRSTDKGQTWSAPIPAATMLPFYGGPVGNSMVTDPDTGQLVQDPINPSFAVDPHSGNLYAVWEDGRFSHFQYNDIAFTMSSDGGNSWSQPSRVNQTPSTIPPADRQAFLPSVAVAGDGTIGVTYYDFRNNTPAPGVPTDYWLVSSLSPDPISPSDWGNEVRLTDTSFDLEASAQAFGQFFLGDYMGLTGSGNDFAAAFTQSDPPNLSSEFFRRVGP